MPFATPEVAIARHPGIILAPRELQGWAADLPMGNPPRAAQLLLQQLRLLVRDPDPGARLPVLLEIYHEPVSRLLEIVTERFDDKLELAVPMDQLESALVDLSTELASGQLRMANDRIAARKPADAGLLYAAMDQLDTAANIERLHYQQRSPARWRQMLAIFLYAEQQRLDQATIDRPPRRDDGPADIRGLFFRSLVIGLCDPHRHRPGDILRWHRWLGNHAGELQLGMLPQGGHSIPVDTSGGLEPLTGARRGKPGPDIRYLAAEHFLQRLRDDTAAPDGLYQALDELIRGRKASDQRASPRQPRKHRFRLLHGLRAVHERLGQLGGGRRGEALLSPADATQVNQSKTGAAFVLPGPVQPPLAVGDTILAEADNPRPGGGPIGFVGHIQRVVNGADGTMEIGVAKLPGRLIPVHLAGSSAERTRGDTHALLQQRPDTDTYGLVATSAVFREGEVIAIEGINVRLDLRMLRLQPLTRRTAYIDVEPAGRS